MLVVHHLYPALPRLWGCISYSLCLAPDLRQPMLLVLTSMSSPLSALLGTPVTGKHSGRWVQANSSLDSLDTT